MSRQYRALNSVCIIAADDMDAQQQADELVERVAFRVVQVLFHAVTRIRDVPVRLQNPGSFRVFWQPNWLTRRERRLHEGT